MHDTTEPARSNPPWRQTLTRILTVVFVVLLAAMLILGTIQVLLQAAGLITGQSQFVVDSAAALGPFTYGIAALFGTITFFLAWSHGWKPGD